MREVALLTSSAGDGLATVVDVLTGTQLSSLKHCSSQPGSTALIAGDFVVSAQVKGTAVHFWAWGTEQPRLKCHAPEKLGPLAVTGRKRCKAVSALAFSPEGYFLFSGGEDAMVSSWNMLAAVDPDGGEAFKGGGGGGGGGKSSLPATWTSSEHSLPVTCLHAAKAGGRVYSCSLDRTAKAWDACSGRLLLSVTCPAFLKAVATDPAEAFLFTGGGGGTIFQVFVQGFLTELVAICCQELHGHEKAVTSLSVTADSSVLVSSSEDGTVRSWHVASRQCVQKTEGVVGGKGAVSQALLMPLPEALMMVRAAGAGGRKRQSVPLSPFDKFMRSSSSSSGKIKPGAGGMGFDFSAGCTPVVLKGAHCPRGRLSGAISGGTGGSASTIGVRAALDAIQGRGLGMQSSRGGGGAATCEGRREEREEGERAAKVAKLEGEIERLRSENLRWQQVNNTLFQKLGAANKPA
ncbi:unnamed protein product [Ectocarpus sp. CCAP 1310/34]|nr:unnamed protein product [Ectocarpus sp. CCAP 1310/34]